MAPGGRVEVLNVNGEIRAEAATGATVHVRAERHVSAGSDEAAQDLLRRIEMREEVGPERVRIETVTPRGHWGGHKVTYTVQVPAGVHVDLRTVNGGVRLDNVGGEVRATATNGGVRGRLTDASLLDARTTNGGVELEHRGYARKGRPCLAGERQRRRPTRRAGGHPGRCHGHGAPMAGSASPTWPSTSRASRPGAASGLG